ncbi:AzlD domain-containing protein [Clostridium estertheticum]|uniref:branched-chain amino acid transporter permease n=1 Tax=Clostridium estertheticum TaxID=238834 RepID=UPI001C7D10C2|nr:AzlD domain-containing protein [Clostridium estertheticum]MBX4262913.1 AzlD domain-containing protein [Clostridium estertheticum]WLC70889.1 AzlD domain-containing protein [Clostridium estertheticum]
MSTSNVYLIATIAIAALVTWGLRAFPFLVFGNRELPPLAKYLGYVLPPAIMVILVCYCIRNARFGEYPYGLAEIMSIVIVILIHIKKKNMYVSIMAGTICYMVLIRTIF